MILCRLQAVRSTLVYSSGSKVGAMARLVRKPLETHAFAQITQCLLRGCECRSSHVTSTNLGEQRVLGIHSSHKILEALWSA